MLSKVQSNIMHIDKEYKRIQQSYDMLTQEQRGIFRANLFDYMVALSKPLIPFLFHSMLYVIRKDVNEEYNVELQPLMHSLKSFIDSREDFVDINGLDLLVEETLTLILDELTVYIKSSQDELTSNVKELLGEFNRLQVFIQEVFSEDPVVLDEYTAIVKTML